MSRLYSITVYYPLLHIDCILKLFTEEGTWCLYANVIYKVIDGGQILL